MKLSHRQFERLVEKALADLPAEFLDRLENILMVIEAEPPEDIADTLGLYEGVPLTERGTNDVPLPDQITLFKGPIERVCENEQDIAREVRLTVLHEVGHYFGMDEQQLEDF